jgi:ParB family chromosome partitioning protein
MPKQDIAAKLAARTMQGADSALDKDYQALFGLPVGVESVVMLPLNCLHLYKNDPFKDRSGEETEQLAASIRENGLHNPIIVRPIEPAGQYEILAGRRRKNAVRLNGDKEIAAIIRDADDNEAVMIVTETNLRHREKLFPSEKAFAYKLQLEAIKRQGKRTDLEDETSTQIAWKKESASVIAEKNDVSKDEIRRYIRLTYLVPQLLDLVGSDVIPFVAGVNLSYLDEPAQMLVHGYFFEDDSGIKLDLKAATALSSAFKESGELTQDMIEALFGDNQKPIPSKTFSISRKKLLPYLDRLPDNNELERLFMEFLESRFGEKDVTDVEKVS